MLDFHESQHPALGNGLISVAGPQDLRNVQRGDVRYLIVNPHDGRDFQFPRVVEAALPQDGDLLRTYIDAERDAGISQLVHAILARVPGGLAITVEPPRAIVDTNRMRTEDAVKDVLSGDSEARAREILAEMHQNILDFVFRVFRSLGLSTKTFDLHSMNDRNTNNQPALSPTSLREFLAAYSDSPGSGRVTDIITGKRNDVPVADMEMVAILEEILHARDIPTAHNEPYDTGEKYPDYHLMVDRPGSVVAIDIVKPQLCEVREGRLFDIAHPVPNGRKVEEMADIFAEAMKRVLH